MDHRTDAGKQTTELAQRRMHMEPMHIPSIIMLVRKMCIRDRDLQVDGLCIPHRDLIPEFVTAGLPQERLFPTGIPVGRQFLHPESREEARRALDLPVDGRILTLACGSMGAGPLRTTAQKVAELMGPEDLLVTICGSNHRMYQQMQSDFFRPVDRVRVLGYTHEMFRYMCASDLLLTKACLLYTSRCV